jgi:predicted glutamine amidotransferase
VTRRKLTRYQPIGTTDSEHAFCYILNVVRREFGTPPPLRRLRQLLARLAEDLSTHGEFNFLLCDSRALFAFCSKKLVYIQRQAPFARAALADDDLEVDFSEVTTPNDRVVVVATAPLTRNETWEPIEQGTLRMFVDGRAA